MKTKNIPPIAPFTLNENGDRTLFASVDGKIGSLTPTGYGQYRFPVDWADNTEFYAEMEFTGNLVGDSNDRVEIRDVQTGVLYNVFTDYLAAYLRAGFITGNSITSMWIVERRSRAYAIALVEVD